MRTPQFGSRSAGWFWLTVFLEVAVKMWTISRMALPPMTVGETLSPSRASPEGGRREGGPEAPVSLRHALSLL